MNTTTISNFRKNMAELLEKSKKKNEPLILGKRKKPEYAIIPLLSEEDREMYNAAGFWKELEEARKEKSIDWEEAKRLLDIE